MIKGLMITPPTLGRIAIGRVVEKKGKRLPEKDDQFTITSQVQTKDGWILHPLDEALRDGNKKLRTIPIKLLFNEPELNLRAEYSMFDRASGRPLCVGNGETCKRYTNSGMQTLACPSPEGCDIAQGGHCKPYGRLNVRIEGEAEDELGTFIFRTTGYNSIRTLAARLNYYQAVSGGLLACMPLELRLRGKSTTMSYRSAIYYVDMTIRDGLSLEEAISEAKALHEQRLQAGYDQRALDDAARLGFSNGAFEDSNEESAEVMEEFYPEQSSTSPQTNETATQSLVSKLNAIKS
ncbi:hydrolase or metal-binding protein [uncultured Paenalcaligenes sp.]|uniref:recombination directionality factor n=1 Tax=uncultured Paenalcaligenes sp. TaxID=1588925 RepID=UPI0026135002|nr:hydrolase or metal-binding protein [uncultured Paenalcaligenes sp.]